MLNRHRWDTVIGPRRMRGILAMLVPRFDEIQAELEALGDRETGSPC